MIMDACKKSITQVNWLDKKKQAGADLGQASLAQSGIGLWCYFSLLFLNWFSKKYYWLDSHQPVTKYK